MLKKIIFSRSDQMLLAEHDDGSATPFECRSDIWPGYNDAGQPRESLPDGNYIIWAEKPGEIQGPAYGSFYIHTGDPTGRGRDIHGGGSDLPDPYARRQGWEATLGCLRMQNEDGETLSSWIIQAGNAALLEVGE